MNSLQQKIIDAIKENDFIDNNDYSSGKIILISGIVALLPNEDESEIRKAIAEWPNVKVLDTLAGSIEIPAQYF